MRGRWQREPLNICAFVILLLGSDLIGGFFFAFSGFIMKALAHVPSTEGIAAMQSINMMGLDRWFPGAFIGTVAILIPLKGYVEVKKHHKDAGSSAAKHRYPGLKIRQDFEVDS